jgi:hypothetical protein
MTTANASDYHEQIENVVALAATTAKPLAENPATIVEGLLAIPNTHDSAFVDLITVKRTRYGEEKTYWGSVHIDFFGSYSGPWHKALAEGDVLKLNVVEG